MPKYVPRLEGIMHSPSGRALSTSIILLFLNKTFNIQYYTYLMGVQTINKYIFNIIDVDNARPEGECIMPSNLGTYFGI
jgi:hypothetical protein